MYLRAHAPDCTFTPPDGRRMVFPGKYSPFNLINNLLYKTQHLPAKFRCEMLIPNGLTALFRLLSSCTSCHASDASFSTVSLRTMFCAWKICWQRIWISFFRLCWSVLRHRRCFVEGGPLQVANARQAACPQIFWSPHAAGAYGAARCGVRREYAFRLTAFAVSLGVVCICMLAKFYPALDFAWLVYMLLRL